MAGTALIRISDVTKNEISSLARESGETMAAVIDRAVELLKRTTHLEKTNAAYASIRANETMARELDSEQTSFESTLLDNLPDDEWAPSDFIVKQKRTRKNEKAG